MNKVQIAGIIVLLIGVALYAFKMNQDLDLVAGILIGLGAGLTVYRQKDNGNN